MVKLSAAMLRAHLDKEPVLDRARRHAACLRTAVVVRDIALDSSMLWRGV
jgi:hypothetical protein